MNSKYLAQYKEKEVWKTISCHRYKTLCSQEPTRWENIELKSKPIQGIRYNVHTRINSTKFCFNRGSTPSNLSENRMTTTHEYITEIISKLEVLNLKIENHDFSFQIKPDTVIHEQEIIKIYCTEKKEIVEYIPDLLIRFSNNIGLVKLWGGQIAIEVNVTHSPNETKRKHFQFIGIPLLEIDASKKLKFENEGKDVGEQILNSYRKQLERELSILIPTSLKYRTYSNRSLANRYYKLKNKNEEIEKKLDELYIKNEELNNENDELDEKLLYYNKKWTNTLKNEQLKFKELQKEYSKLKNRSFFRKVLSLFGND